MPRRNLLKIPKVVLDRLSTFDQDDVIAATVKLISSLDLADYGALGLFLQNGDLIVPSPTPPNPNAGKYSRANVFGLETVRRDLPKIKKEFGFWAPSWNSGSYHYVSHDRDVYQRDFLPPKEVNLAISLVERRGQDFIVRFTIDQVINRRTPNFETELLYNLNLLQENVGAADVYPSETSLSEYAETIRVDWRILPPGTPEQILNAILMGRATFSEQERHIMKERIEVMARFKPKAFIAGSDGFLRYFGAQFGDDFVAFENVRYGNALYIMYEEWSTLSRKSRIDLLAGERSGFDRIVHKAGWEQRFAGRVKEYQKRRKR